MGSNLKSPPRIIYENDDFLIVDKESGITVNRSDTTSKEETLQDLIEHLRKIDKNDPDSEFVSRGGIVHRLDKETSGLIIVAKNGAAFRILQSQFKNREVGKSYIALVHGQIIPSKGQIKAAISRLPWNRKRFGVLAGGREAITKYEVLSIKSLALNEKKEPLSLVRLYPKTGRTHQIRVHLKYIGHPIFGDLLYAGRKTSREDRRHLPRIFLHAESLTFADPTTGQKLEFKSELPGELKKFVDEMKKVVIDSN